MTGLLGCVNGVLTMAHMFGAGDPYPAIQESTLNDTWIPEMASGMFLG